MQYTQIAGTPFEVSQICLGTGSFGSSTPAAAAFALLDAFVAQGGNFIDTARIYAAWLPDGANASERTIGDWLQARGRRDQVVLATKGGHPDLQTMHISRLSRAEVTADVEASLRYLQTETIDLYYLHRDAPDLPVGDILETLNALVQAGKIRYLGCSNWTAARIHEANAWAAENNLAGFVANQPLWSLAHPNPLADQTLVAMDAAGMEFHRETGLTAVPYTSQARGYFTKRAENRLRAADRQQYDNPINDARFAHVQALAQQHNVSITAIALSYLTSQPFPVAPIIGPRSLDQLHDSLRAADLNLSPTELVGLAVMVD